jgi:hypothetical protein
MKKITLSKKRAYGYVKINMPEDNISGEITVKTEEEGIVIDCFNDHGNGIASMTIWYDDLQMETE